MDSEEWIKRLKKKKRERETNKSGQRRAGVRQLWDKKTRVRGRKKKEERKKKRGRNRRKIGIRSEATCARAYVLSATRH